MQNDPSYVLRQAIKDAISASYGNKTYQVELYEKLQYPDYYIKIGYPVIVNDSEAQDNYQYAATINIEVINQRFKQNHSAEAEMVNIVDDINSAIVRQSLTMTGFEMVIEPYITGYQTIETLIPQEKSEIKKIITYNFIIQQS